MKAEEYRAQVDFEGSLNPGDEVAAFWTNRGYSFVCKAEVVRVNRASVRVSIVEPPEGDDYPVGHHLVIPRLVISAMDRWSANNRVAPVGWLEGARSAARCVPVAWLAGQGLTSECCDAPPLGEVDDHAKPAVGICSRCRDNACFYSESERCPECGGPPDERVKAGMKCATCAYQGEVDSREAFERIQREGLDDGVAAELAAEARTHGE